MNIFIYDKTFEGLLNAIFDAYSRKTFPDLLLSEDETLPLFYDDLHIVYTDNDKAERVWNGLMKKLSRPALSCLAASWLSELPEIDLLIFRYIRKAIDSPCSIELNFGDNDVLELSQIWKKVHREQHRIIQFLRFQKAMDGTFFAAIEPIYNVLSLIVPHCKDRFSDQKWIIYDLKREYGYYYDLSSVTEIQFENSNAHLLSGILDKNQMHPDEELFQKLWKEYFKAINIKERNNLKLHRQNLPVRFWKHLTEKQK